METENVEQLLQRLASCSSPSEVLEIVKESTALPNLFVFGEFLESPLLCKVANDDSYQPALRLLRLFAFGTYKDYLDMKDDLVELSPQHIGKLQMLTVASLASSAKVLSYDILLRELQMENIRDLENLLIECIYEGVIKGKLDHKGKQFIVEYALGRDLKDGDLDKMINILTQWQSNSEQLLGSIDLQKAFIRQEHDTILASKKESKRMAKEKSEIIEAAKV